MKVLHITAGSISGGGTTAFVNNLHHGLLKQGTGSRILSTGPVSLNTEFIPFKTVKYVDMFMHKATSAFGLNNLTAMNSFRLSGKDYFEEADVLHLNTIHSNNFNYFALPSVTRKKPAVWTFHDVWGMTGHCSMSMECQRWKTGCGKCPHPEAWPPIQRDATALEIRLKKWIYGKSRLFIAAPSRWMMDMVRQSICKDLPLTYIPNGIDTDVFKPAERGSVRQTLGIPPGKKVLMAAAVRLDDERKGGDLLRKALELLPASLKMGLILLTMGQAGSELIAGTGVEMFPMGYLADDALKALCYAASDLFVLPTRLDNAALVIPESMACGTPVVSFRVGGVPEVVRDGVTGFTAEPEDAAGLSRSIARFFEDKASARAMGERARKTAVDEFSLDLMTERYVGLYEKAAA